jgi:small-conductance mechanosensitive channel
VPRTGSEITVLLGAIIGSALLALLAVEVVHRAVVRLGRRSASLARLAERTHRPAQVFFVLVAIDIAMSAGTRGGGWRAPLLHGLGLALIATGAWLFAALLTVLEDAALSHVRTDVTDNRHARRIHTQISLIRRVTVVVVSVIAIGAMLMTFPGARAAGTSILASAGVIGAIAALAAQSLLGNVIAGVQIAFSDALRLDDVVIVENQWGRVEDITLTYVVVHLWDDRRLILPTSYFLKNPFENWTRTGSALLGTVELEVDWSVPVEAMREELRRTLESSELWDGRVCVLQVTDAVNAFVRLRALVSAADAGQLWDLRCLVRENLVSWLREHHSGALPKIRIAEAHHNGAITRRPGIERSEHDSDARMFGESEDGQERVQAFGGPSSN